MDLASILGSTGPRPSPATAFNFLFGNLKKESVGAFGGLNEGYDPTLSPLPCESIGELIASVKTKIKLSKSAEDGIIMMMAVAISLKVDGPFLWMHMTGPSSSLKSTILNLVTAAYDKVFSLTEFKGFYSGSTVGGKDNSLLPQLQDKLFVIHDFTPIIQGRPEVQNEVCGQFRVIYEGTGEAFYKNGESRSYSNIRFACITGVTHVIYAFRRTDMGERFLIFDINSEWTEDGLNRKIEAELEAEGNAFDSIFSTISSGLSEKEGPKLDQLDEQRRLCWGLLNNLMEYIEDEAHGLKALARAFSADREFKSEIDALAVWMEHARCNLPAKNEGYVRITPAEPHRSIKQLAKTAMCIAIVLKADNVVEEVKRLTKKLAFDTAKSFSLEIMNYLAIYPKTAKVILASKMNLSGTWVSHICDHLVSLGVIRTCFKSNNAGVGRDTLCYELTDKFRTYADRIGLKEKYVERPVDKFMAGITQRSFGRTKS